MDNFWTAEDKIPISQKRVSVPSQNGLEYSGGQRVVIEVPPTIQFIQPRESYLWSTIFNLSNTGVFWGCGKNFVGGDTRVQYFD
jgi:hypothetical protein